MQPYSDYEIAQRQIVKHQNNEKQFRASIGFTIFSLFATIFNPYTAVFTILLVIAGVVIMAISGIQLYYSTPEHVATREEIEQEMLWLFGEDWHDQASAQAYALAQDRIRKLRISKWQFAAHMLVFIPVIYGIISPIPLYHIVPNDIITLGLALIWLFIIFRHARSAFPSKQMLQKREIEFGQTLHIELTRLQPTKVKPKEKLKRGKYYQVGDDGELEEVEDDKPKRSSS